MISEKEFNIIVNNNANPKYVSGFMSWIWYMTFGRITNPTIASLVWNMTKQKFNSNV